MKNLEDLKAQIAARFPDSRVGRPCAISDTGEEYQEIFYRGICRDREYDIACLKEFALTQFLSLFDRYADGGKSGRFSLYWRIPLEDDLTRHGVIEHYDENGPDVDFYTDRRCFMDKNWKMYCVYARLLISDKPKLPET